MDDFSPAEKNSKPAKKWYRTPGGIVFLVVISIILAGVLFFVAFFSYYLYEIKYGDSDAVVKGFKNEAKQMSQVFGIKNNTSKQTEKIIQDYQKYVRKGNPIKGKADAPITILMFIDFECPYCRQAYLDFNKVMTQYSPVVKFVFKNLPGDTHTNALPAALAGTCAEEQGKFWQYYDLLFQRQQLDQDSLIQDAKELNLDVVSFSDCLTSQKYLDNITEDLLDVADIGIIGTPSYLVNGEKYEGVFKVQDWDKIILKFLK